MAPLLAFWHVFSVLSRVATKKDIFFDPWAVTTTITHYTTCLTREQEGRPERSAGTLERKSKGSPSSIDSNVEMVST